MIISTRDEGHEHPTKHTLGNLFDQPMVQTPKAPRPAKPLPMAIPDDPAHAFVTQFEQWLTDDYPKLQPFRNPGLHASSLWKTCARREVLLADAPPEIRKGEHRRAGSHLTVDVGTALHDWWRHRYLGPWGTLIGNWHCIRCNRIVQQGLQPVECPVCKGPRDDVIVYSEVRIFDEAMHFEGSVDGFFRWPGAPPAPALPVHDSLRQGGDQFIVRLKDGTRRRMTPVTEESAAFVSDGLTFGLLHFELAPASEGAAALRWLPADSWVFEYKTISDTQYNALDKPKLEHVTQVHAYMQVLGLRHALIVYAAKGAQCKWTKADGVFQQVGPVNVRAFHVRFDPEHWGVYADRVKDYHDVQRALLSAPDLPALTKKYTRICPQPRHPMAEECPVMDRCFTMDL